MKTIIKSDCPPLLAKYAASFPNATWEGLRDDALHGGDAAYREMRKRLIMDQKGLCAYCESKLLEDAPHTIRVEHFHPKSDSVSGHNWHIDWQNLLATCTGGERDREFSLPENLSCDSHKKNEIHDDDILNPLFLPPFPAAFCYDMVTGELLPNPEFCNAYPELSSSKFQKTHDLLLNTLRVLNLNCDRLRRARLEISHSLEVEKKRLREQHAKPSVVLPRLVQHYFGNQWPQYFSVLRYCLQPYADKYLRSINYEG